MRASITSSPRPVTRAASASRSLVSQIQHYLSDEGESAALADLAVAAVYALKHELRGTDPDADFRRLLGADAAQARLDSLWKTRQPTISSGEKK